MTYYSQYEFSTADLAGAVAEAALEDLRVNGYGFDGFPQIVVTADASRTVFVVKISWNVHAICEMEFDISLIEAKAAVKTFKSQSGYDKSIFARVQTALAALEGKASDAHRHAMMG
jgi:hypothetical protein